ncbi:MAG TPA: polysaccharide deacetylase family protein [Verrucomicrobiae bacterium]|nr:polysaccharide deacetylase family protein [Verrucomicrobiae bacterium]
MSIRRLVSVTRRIGIGFSVLVLSTGMAAMQVPARTVAATTAPQSTAKISFTFDDGLQSTYTEAAPILAEYGLTGTDYVITGPTCIGQTTVPNSCAANGDRAYMTWAQVQALQNTDGWEIGSHTVDHDCLADSGEDDPSDCANPTPLTTAQVDAELSNSQQTLASEGINATDFAPPYGDYNNNVLAQIAKYYASMRQFKNSADNANVWPYSDYYLQDITAQEGVTPVSKIETDINNAISNNQWLVLTFHDIATKPSTNANDWQYGTSELQQIAAYVQSKEQAGQIQSVHVDQGLVTSNTNMLPNSSFAAGISDGWTTDSPSTITADSGDNGSYPNPTYSTKLTSGSSAGHLFSPKVAINPNTTYVLKNFLNLQAITSGEVAFYIDEYNAQGDWISGQYKTQEVNPFVEDLNFTYTPSSSSVAQASLQVIVNGTGITGYFANPQWFPASTTTPTNLLPNGNFAAGISDGWTTDSATNIYADSNGNGAPDNPQYSVSLNAPTTSNNAHLFSPEIAVTPGDTYSITNWLNIKQLTSGVVGFYVDEYNSSGAWISGQYLASDSTLGPENVGFTYTPSSSSVSKAALQVIVVGNSGLQAYYDDAVWSPPSS